MKYLDEFRARGPAEALIEKIQARNTDRPNFMEVCGTHTVAILKSGIKERLRGKINLISGPGCPVCVTSSQDVDKAISVAGIDGAILTTFGDMIRVPGTSSSLEKERAEGRDIRVIYSTMDAVAMAEKNPSKSVVLLAVGFETTTPTIAYAVSLAYERKLSNFFILSLNKLIPPAMSALLEMGEINLHGFICPGHVSTIIGPDPYRFISRDYGIPCVIAGFEATDILQAILMLLSHQEGAESRVMIQYKRSVTENGNPAALGLVDEVFERNDARWRGIGIIPESGLKLREKYKKYDVEDRFDIPQGTDHEPSDCICGRILRGISQPGDCKLFGKRCHPDHPIGPCMVSSEGTCAAHYFYGREER